MLCSQASGQNLVVNEKFADGDRTTQAVPDSLAWYCSAAGANLTVSSQAMTLATSGGSRHAVAYFPVQTLAVGGTINLGFKFSVTNPRNVASGIRIGLFNTNSSSHILAADADDANVTYTGYSAWTNPAPSTASSMSFRKRSDVTAASLLTSTTAYGSAIDSAGGVQQSFVSGTTYTASLKITRTGTSEVTLTLTYAGGALSGYTVTRSDTSSIVTTFDTVGFEVDTSGSAAADSITVDDLTVTSTYPSVAAKDGFDDGERATQALPDSMAWYCSAAGTNLTVSSQAMTLNSSGGARHAVANFPRQVLEVGSAINLSFKFSVTNPRDISSGLRFGFFNTNGSTAIIGRDGFDAYDPNVTYTGYCAWTNPAPSAANTASFRKRSDTTAARLMTISTAYSSAISSGGGPQQSFVAGTTYTASLTITRTAADQVSLTLTYTGGALSGYTFTRTDTSGTISSFDAVGIEVHTSGQPAVDSITVDDVAVTLDRPALMTESFTDGDRTTQSLPTSAAWFGNTNTAMAVSSNALVITPGSTTGSTALAYLTASSAGPVVLAPGDSLQATFKVKFSGSAFPINRNFFRTGFFNSYGTTADRNAATTANRLTADGYDATTTAIQTYTGYMATASLNPINAASGLVTYARSASTQSYGLTTLGIFGAVGSKLGTGKGSAYGFVPGNTYVGTLTVQRVGTASVAVSLGFTGTFANGTGNSWSCSNLSHAGVTYTFDTIMFHCDKNPSGASVSDLTVDDLVVSHQTSAGYPSILTQPVTQTNDPGDNVTFTAAASAAPAATYQWLKGTTAISGATTTSLALTNVQAADDSSYSMTITNDLGTISTAAAALNVNAPPVITAQPSGISGYVGDNVKLSVLATGTRNLDYQWKKNGTPISGATSPILALDNIQTSDAANYTVTITNALSSVTSSTAALAVTASAPPAVINSAATANAGVGTIFTYQITTTAPYAPTTYSATSLPTGLTLDTVTGIIEGRPVATGSPVINIYATNSGGTASSTLTLTVAAAPSPITTMTAFKSALSAATQGSIIVLANGSYANPGLMNFIKTGGTASQPVVIRAETPGMVTFTGTAQLVIGRAGSSPVQASYTVVDGFRFESGRPAPGTDGITSPGAINLANANNCRVTECAIIDFNDGVDPSQTVSWVSANGPNDRIDHCYFKGKRGEGALIGVIRRDSAPDYLRIDHNAFIDFQDGGSEQINGFEVVRLGDSSNALTDSYSVVEWNYYESCNAEGELMANKSGRNTYRYNTVIDSEAGLNLRVGLGCTVESNFIQQSGVTGQNGLRVSDRDHIVRYNYIEGIRYRYAGDPYNSGLGFNDSNAFNAFAGAAVWDTYNILVEHNTIIDCEASFTYGTGYTGAGATIYPAHDIRFVQNVARSGLVGSNYPIVAVRDPLVSSTYSGDVYYGGVSGNTGLSTPLPAGVTDTNPSLTPTTLNGYTLQLSSPGGVGTDANHIFPLTEADVGPLYYTP